jgi:hypothetical protein
MIGVEDRQQAWLWRRTRAVAALLAIVAVVFNGFVPGLQHLAMARAASGDVAALCTSDGSAGAASLAGDPQGGAPASLADECCGLCILGGAGLIAPAPLVPVPPGVVACAEPPAVTTAAVHYAPTGPPLPARGPPLFS